MSCDLNKVISIASSFSKATGIACATLENSTCGYCAIYQTLTKERLNCERTHLFAATQSQRFGGQYIFMCPQGFVHFVVPIEDNGKLISALLGGPVLITDKDDFIDQELAGKGLEPQQKEMLIRELEFIPQVAKDRIPHLCQLLFYCAEDVSCQADFSARESSLKRQSDISSYIHSLKQEEQPYPVEKEDALLRFIEMGDKQNAQKLLNELLGNILFSSGGKLELIRARVLELIVLLSRSAMHKGADSGTIFGMNYQYINEINAFKNMEELINWLSKIMIRFTEYTFNFKGSKYSSILNKAILYMHSNYMNRISLEEVANHVNLSPSYFCRIFKEEIGLSFSSYLNTIRVNQSKRLMASGQLSFVDIANMIGFPDQSYFNKIFKRFTGQTPKKYKEQI